MLTKKTGMFILFGGLKSFYSEQNKNGNKSQAVKIWNIFLFSRAPGTGVISADSFVNFNSHLETATLV